MNDWLIPGLLGLLTGLLLHWTQLDRPCAMRNALGLRRAFALRSGLSALGWGMALTALLCWLAVIDVDTVRVLPLSLGAIAGGLLLGGAAGLCGFTPGTAFAGLACSPLEALCVLMGCAAMTWLMPLGEGLLLPLRYAAPYADATVFRVTLDGAYLLRGGFAGQGCVGLALVVIALCVPTPRMVLLTDEEVARRAAALPPPAPADVSTFVATLPGEEPLVVDTAQDDESDESDESDASDESDVSAEDEPDAK